MKITWTVSETGEITFNDNEGNTIIVTSQQLEEALLLSRLTISNASEGLSGLKGKVNYLQQILPKVQEPEGGKYNPSQDRYSD